MKKSLHIAKLIFLVAIAILFLSGGIAQASSVNIVDINPSLNIETMAGNSVEWSWYIYNNDTSPILLILDIDITEDVDNIASHSAYVNGSPYHREGVQIDPGQGVNVKVIVGIDKLASTSIVETLVTLTTTNLVTHNVESYDFILEADISSLYSGDDSYNKIMGIITNSLPAPLDNHWGALLITLIVYAGFAIVLYAIAFPLVLKLPILRNREIYQQILSIMRSPLFVLVFLYGAIQSLYIIGADESILITVNMLVNVIYIILTAMISWSLYEMFARHLLIQYNVKKKMQNDMSLLPLLNWIGKVIVTLASASAILAALGFNIMVILTGAGILGLAISLGAQDTLNKFFCGLSLLIERPFKEGDLLQMEDGIVVEAIRVGLRSTTFYNTFDPQYFTIPNDIVANSKLVNVLRPDARYKAKVDIGVAYGSDVALVKKAMLEAAMDHPETLKTEKEMPMVRFMGFGDSSLNFRLFTWVNDFNDHYRILGDLREAIDANFRRYGIEIPFPQRDIWIRKKDREE